MMQRAIGFGAVLGIGIAACIALWPARAQPKFTRNPAPIAVARSAERAEPSALKQAPPLPVTQASLDVRPPHAAPLLDEPSLMSTLRTLGDSQPERSLQLARDAQQRFPGNADAPEQEWYVCKSLVNLERFYDARDEARLMVAAYPDTTWAQDVARHLLVNPLDLPGDPAP